MNIDVTSTAYKIYNYELGQDKRLEKALTTFDDIYYKVIDVALEYDENNKILYVPKGIGLNEFMQYKDERFNYIKPNKLHKIDIDMVVPPRDNNQKIILMYLYGVGEFKYTTKYSQLMLTMPTGTGKTYCAIAGISLFKARAIVINFDSKTRQQWVDRVLQYTTIKENEVLQLNPTNLFDIWNDENFDAEKYKFYSTTHDTIDGIARKIGWGNLDKLFEKLKIGIKVYDESHKEIKNMYRTDFHTNTNKTFYVTATPKQSDPKMNKIYQLTFSHMPEYGMDLFDTSTKELKAVIYELNSNANMYKRESLKTVKGLSSTKYAQYAFSDTNMPVYRYIKHALAIYSKLFGGYRCIIYISTIEECESFREYMIEELGYPKDMVGLYHSKMNTKVKEDVYNNSRIIISPMKSLGTAKDIANLRVIINTETYKSEVNTEQMIGRLRDGGLFFDCYDVSIPECINQYKSRLKIIKTQVRKILNTKI